MAAFRQAGYAVVGTARSMPRLRRARLSSTVTGDIADAATRPSAWCDQALDRFGRIDTLVNNAGVFIGKPFTDYTVDDFAAITAVNLAGFFHITQRDDPPDGRAGRRPHRQHHHQPRRPRRQPAGPAALAALTKGGLAAVTRSLAIEYASRGVRVNAVALGVIKTPVHDPASYDGLAGASPARPHRRGRATSSTRSSISSGRTFVTGEILHIDGGQAAGH